MVAMMPTAENAETEKTTFSRNVSRLFGLDLHSWEQLMLVSLGFAALAAVAIVVTTAAVVRVQKLEAEEAKRELELYKLDAATKISEANSAGETAKMHAAEANSEAGKANERAASLERDAEQARGQIASANSAIADAVKQTESAKAVAAEANRKAEEERLERLKLEATVAPRNLSLAEQRTIASVLSRFAGRKVRIRSYALDVEAAVFGQQIMNCLQGANIPFDDHRMSESSLGAVATGVRVTGQDGAFVTAILKALSSLGRVAVSPEAPPQGAAGMSMGDDGTAAAATIFVGVKPIAPVR
jgi:hypothetical protein